MKKILYILLVMPLYCLGQTTTQNFIKSVTYKDPVTTTDETKANVNVTYYDGLGRPLQQVAGKASGTGKDIITHIEYDGLGRQPIEYMPYASGTSDLTFDMSGKANTEGFYNTESFENTTNPYTQKFFDNTPLNRVVKQAAPGNVWAGSISNDNDHTVKFAYSTRGAKRLRAIANWNTTTKQYEPTFVDDGSYTAGELYLTITQDENRASSINLTNSTNNFNTTEEYKSKEGQVVLKSTYNIYVSKQFGTSSPTRLDTYYVYDQFGNLTYVLPPSLNGIFDANNCYQYKYDGRNRLTEKKIPGKQWEYIVYDGLDRVVATGPVYSPFGTGEEGWIHNVYDIFGRLSFTGWYPVAGINSTTRKALQDTNLSSVSVARYNKSGSSTVDGISIDYNTSTISLPSGFKLLKVNYYDNYKFTGSPGDPPFAAIESQPVSGEVKGLPTGSWTRVPTTATETLNEVAYLMYDAKGRVIRQRMTTYLSGYTQTTNKLDFDGSLVYTLCSHRRAGISSIVINTREDFVYTAQDRLLSQTHKINSATPELMAQNSYNELGQLIKKSVGGADATGVVALQKVDYSYNIRGWLKGINDISDLALPNDPQDLFAFNINYTNSPGQSINGNVKPLYNGNIAETSWRTPSDNIKRRYGYSYDNLNQLTAAWYQIPTATIPVRNSYDERIYYDIDGSIKNLERNGESDTSTTTIEIDDLVYTYDSTYKSRLMKVTDTSGHSKGFKDSADNSVNDYSYDVYGNVLSDRNKGITNIKYNHLNLPTEIIFNNSTTQKINYIYNADGTKVKKEVTDGSTVTTTDYLTGFQYTNAGLDFLSTPEGYAKATFGGTAPSTGRYNYVFNYKDHLGNNRISYTVDPADGLVKIIDENHYYPFGLKHNGYSSGQQMLREIQFEPYVVITPVLNPTTASYKYKYNGKELQNEIIGISAENPTGFSLDMYDYGARNYDAAIGRWMNIDPLAEASKSSTPYNYCYNNPILFVDRNGMLASDPTEIYNRDGNKIGEDSKGIDGNVSIITDPDKAKEIEKRNGVATEADVASGIQTTKSALKEALDVLNRTEKNGGMKEESSMVTTDGDVTRQPTGPLYEYKEGDHPANAEGGNLLPPNGKSWSDVMVIIHSHLLGFKQFGSSSDSRGVEIYSMSAQEPSPADVKSSSDVPLTIIVGRMGLATARWENNKRGEKEWKVSQPRLGISIYTSGSEKPAINLTRDEVKKILK